MSSPSHAPTTVAPVFSSILCGVDGSRPSQEAARQAAALTEPGTALSYVAVSSELGKGATAVATLTHEHAEAYLRRARDEAREVGIDPLVVDDHADDPGRRLVELGRAHDLLVLGIVGHSRGAGIMTGSAATTALHRSSVPVLVARRPPEGAAFPSRIVLASDGTPASSAAAELTARLAARHGACVAVVNAGESNQATRRGLAQQAALIREQTGTEPVVIGGRAPAHRAVADAARDFGATLVVTGSRGLTGVAALASASERIAHAAPCSVLVVRS